MSLDSNEALWASFEDPSHLIDELDNAERAKAEQETKPGDEENPVQANAISQNSSYDKLVEDLTSEMLQYSTPAPTQEASTTSNDRNGSMTSTCSNVSSTTCATKSVDTVATTVAGSKSSLGKRFSSDTSVITNKRPLKAVKTGVTSFQEPVYVAYSKPHQRLFDARNLSFGIQWEIHRVIMSKDLGYDQIPIAGLDQLRQLGSCSKAVPQVERTIAGRSDKSELAFPGKNNPFAEEQASIFPWDEFDREEKALEEDPYAGLGCDSNSDWFGGKVVFRMTLRSGLKTSLEKVELGASNRFARRWGSKSFVRVKVSKDLWSSGDALVEYFKRPFVICGKIYRAFLEKDRTVFLFRTNESLDSNGQIVADKNTSGLSLEDFMEFHNPLSENQMQSAAKYASRFALGLSTSAPGLRVQPENILDLDDIVSAEGSEMTDGAGFINRAGLRKLNHKFGWHDHAVAIQCRIAGAKGMLSEHPCDDHEEPRVWLRPSQIKIQYEKDVLAREPALQTIDVLRSSHSRHGCRLSAETIIILEDNGVPKEVFSSLLEEGVKDVITAFTTWSGPTAMFDLYATVDRAGGVTAARKARLDPGMARLKGYRENYNEAQEEEDEDELDQFDKTESSVAWFPDEISGQPSSLEETVMYACASGFTPQSCPLMKEKLRQVFIKEMDKFSRTLRVDVRMACTAFILPDPIGVLKEGEVYFKSSHRNLLSSDGSETDIVIGDVLVTRHPCKLPTDIQKWKAVDKRELHEYTDIIYFSTKGLRRAADYLGGGDYDGDKCLLIFQPEIVDPFKNAALSFANPRDDIKEEYFSRHTETVKELLHRAPRTREHPSAHIHALQEYLLGGLKVPSLVGQASNMHDYLLYTKGPRHQDSILLSHIFCHTLDGAKTGLKPIQEKLTNLRKKYDKGPMHWKTKSNDTLVSRPDNAYKGIRSSRLPPFVMDYLKKYASDKVGKEKDRVNKECFESIRVVVDDHLVAPYLEAKELVKRQCEVTKCDIAEKELKAIEDHVAKMYEIHQDRLRMPGGEKGFTDKRIETRQNILRSISREFAVSPPPSGLCTMSADQVDRVKASYAYWYDSRNSLNGWSRFPWNVAMRELCAIKAKALGRYNTITGSFYDSFTIRKAR